MLVLGIIHSAVWEFMKKSYFPVHEHPSMRDFNLPRQINTLDGYTTVIQFVCCVYNIPKSTFVDIFDITVGVNQAKSK